MTMDTSTLWAYKRLLGQMTRDGLKELPTIEQLSTIFKYVELTKGGVYLQQGVIEQRIAFVVTGAFRYFYITPKGEDITKHFSLENDFVCSYASMIYQRPTAYGIVAEEDAVLLVIEHSVYMHLIQQDRNWERLARKYTEHIYNLKELREASLLLQDAKERYNTFRVSQPEVVKRFKQRHIATYLGIHPVTLSRLRKDEK